MFLSIALIHTIAVYKTSRNLIKNINFIFDDILEKEEIVQN